MIRFEDAKTGMHVFYQVPPMRHPEYGVITGTNAYYCADRCRLLVFVRFGAETCSKGCYPRDLYWPPDYCAMNDCNPKGQRFSAPEEMPPFVNGELKAKGATV